jgi:hypothetical protein
MCAIGFCAAFAMSGDPRSGQAVAEDSVLTVVQESSAQVGRTLPKNTVVATNVSHNLARNQTCSVLGSEMMVSSGKRARV